MSDQPHADHAEAAQKPTLKERLSGPLRLLSRAIRQRPLASGLVGLGLAASMTAFVIVATSLPHADSSPNLRPAQRALEALDQGNVDIAKDLAIRVHEHTSSSYRDIGTAAFVLGSLAAQQAAQEWDQRKRQNFFLVASRYLEEADQRGLPPQLRGRGTYLLATSLYRGGRQTDSIPHLLAALKATPKHRSQLHRMLAGAYTESSNPRHDQALEHIQQYFDDPNLPANRLHEAQILQSRILFQRGDTQQSRAVLDTIPEDSPLRAKATVMQAQLLMDQGERLTLQGQANGDAADLQPAIQQYRAAIEALLLARQQDNAQTDATGAADYLMGICHRELGELAAARQLFAETRRRNFDSPLGLAAGIAEADVLLQLGQSEDSLDSFVRVLSEAGSSETFSNPWITLIEFQSLVRQAYDRLWDTGQFSNAVRLAQSLAAIFPGSESLQWQGEAHEAWAQQLLADADGLPIPQSQPVRQEARSHFRTAARLFHQLAKLRYATRQYPDDLWNSAINYSRGHDFRNTVRRAQQFIQDGPRNRLPQAQVILGDALLSLNRLDEALVPLLDCVQSTPNDPSSYQARLTASQVYIEKDQLDKAREMLLENLENGALTPDSIEWRDALFALGKLQYLEGMIHEAESRKSGVDQVLTVKKGLPELEKSHQFFQESIGTLDEFVERYAGQPVPDANRRSQVIEARYLMADAHRQAAKWPRKKLATVTIETTRAALTRQSRADLRQASDIFLQLEVDLRRRQDEAELSKVEQAILRNCYFTLADSLFDMGRYEDAIGAYSSATNRYHDRPESLEAFVQIASCYRRMNRPAEARVTLQQARSVLSRIDPAAQFTKTTRYDREQWSQLIDWLSTL